VVEVGLALPPVGRESGPPTFIQMGDGFQVANITETQLMNGSGRAVFKPHPAARDAPKFLRQLFWAIYDQDSSIINWKMHGTRTASLSSVWMSVASSLADGGAGHHAASCNSNILRCADLFCSTDAEAN
jgi:hypothetical protein